MSDIEEHQRRIADALERIATLTDSLPVAGDGSGETSRALAAAEARAAAAEAESARLAQENAALRRAAPGEGEATDADLRAEIDRLRAARAEERAEIESILGALAPILQDGENRHA